MSDSGYSGQTAETKWGCAASAIVGAPLFAFLLLADALGDCVPDTDCKHGFFSQVLMPSVVIATSMGFLVWTAVRIIRVRKKTGSKSVTLNLFQGPSIGLRRSLEGQTALAVLPFDT